ncbi:uncharacterized protein TRAVEDRAFT_92087, partial [Trametes versicolor FP-101664 SS1]|uniref:uncharacterized protein n=1 Tax=Trametes versicolor (strain FP-101664) TaxID=717944 RepID=UPI0004622E9C
PFDNPSADVVIRSCDLVEFHVRSHILMEASPVLQTMLAQTPPPPPQPWLRKQTSSPVLELPEDGRTIETLLRICYPIVHPESYASPGEVESALRAAIKYEMELPTKLAQLGLFSLASTSPLRTYLTTVTRGLDDCAGAAARKAIDLPIETTYLEELEQCPALAYHRLLSYRDACQNVAVRILRY